ncbi:MAG: HD-GYP domain-containing protein, partial [Candidatus Omnitrophica bacterium]|nr:HD-GYP domain-containing protein [Candidatus Omnitrophota bacterium]
IYTMAKTSQKGTLQFVVDPDVFNPQSMEAATSYPGDRYDASRFPEMIKSFYYPTTDESLGKDEWGVVISGYAPVKDKDGRTAGIVGIDLAAEHVYNLEREIYLRGAIVLVFVFIFALVSGPLFSRKIIRPLHILLEGTRKIAKGDLQYKVEVKGSAELKELADAFNSMSLSLQDSQKLMHDYFYSLMESMVRILEDRDPYSRGHSDRVALYAEKIAMEMEYSPSEVALVRKAALLHDIGNLGVDKSILDKTTPLTPEEIKIIQEHPVVGENILKPIVFDKEILPIVRSHHERFDGKGYPDKLKAKDINIFAQIISVADAYDAMISPRPYHPVITREQAIMELKKGSGSQFNPWIVRNMLKILYSEQY